MLLNKPITKSQFSSLIFIAGITVFSPTDGWANIIVIIAFFLLVFAIRSISKKYLGSWDDEQVPTQH